MENENSRVHTGRLLLPGWEDQILNRQKYEDSHWRWLEHANYGSTLPRHVQLLRGSSFSPYTSFIEQARVLPAKQAAKLRDDMLRKFAPEKKTLSSPPLVSSIEAPQYQQQQRQAGSKARFTQSGMSSTSTTHTQTKAGGADPWWLNPPPWWLPPPPEWGSPPPSVYSPFYSPGSIQQPGGGNSPAHNSYPAFTPTPPPY